MCLMAVESGKQRNTKFFLRYLLKLYSVARSNWIDTLINVNSEGGKVLSEISTH